MADKKIETVAFGVALEHIRKGGKAGRVGWSQRMCVFIEPAQLPSQVELLPCFCMRLADNTVMLGWLPGRNDLFAQDWILQ